MKKSDIHPPEKNRQRNVSSPVWLILAIFAVVALCVVPAWAENVSASGANVSGIDGDMNGTVLSPLDPESGGDGNVTTSMLPVISWVNVTPASAEMTVGEVRSFSAAAYDPSGAVVPDVVFSWESSDPSVGTVNGTGSFTALTPGSVVIIATVANGTVNGSAAATVTAPLPEVSPTPVDTMEVLSSVRDVFGGVIPAVDDVYLKVANDEGARFNDFGNDTFRIKWTGGGLNAVHISNSSGYMQYGQVTNTHDQSGTFYVTETGGRGYHDEIFLCVAVNGTIPDDFKVHIRADGYQWVPNPIPHAEPAPGTEHYEPVTLDEWFTKDDFIYGPQTWRPAAETRYPVFPGQDLSDTSNTFRLMFVDLNGGILRAHPLRVQYEVENLNTLLAFNVYGYCKNADPGVYNLTSWTNRLTGPYPTEFSGWYVSGVPLPDAATLSISPPSAEVPANGKQRFTARAYDANGDEIKGAQISWSSSDPGVGTIDNKGIFTSVSEGSTIITASTKGASQTASVTVTAPVEKVLTSILLEPSDVVMYADQIENCTFTATGYDQFGDEISPVLVTWSSTVPSVGTIDENGLFTGRGEGTTIVRATNGSVSGNATVVIKSHPDWNINLIGAVNGMLNRSTIIDLSKGGLLSYTDPSGKLWEGVSLSAVIGLVDDQDPATFNTSLASRDYTVTVIGKAAGNDKTIQITSREFLDGDKTFIAGYKVDGFEIPEEPIDGRTYWPLKLTGSGIAHVGKNIEEVTEISLEFPPDIREINITPDIVRIWESGEPLQFSGEAYDPSGAEIPFVPFRWTSSNTSVGAVNQTGYFTIMGPGTTEVRASFAGVESSATVYVYPDDLPPHTWIVDQSGEGDFRTITEAVACARDIDTVLVRDGIYDELFKIEKGITLRSENGPSGTTITNDKRAFMIEVLADNVSISGFTLKQTGSATFASKNAIRITEGDNCTISGNIFSDTQYCIYVYKQHVSNLTLAGNKFNNSKTSVYLNTCDHALVRDNIIENAFDTSISIMGDGRSSGNIVENNTISSIYNRGTGISFLRCRDGRVSNNVIYNGVSKGLYIVDTQNTVVKDNFIDECAESNVNLRNSIKDITFTGNELKGGKIGSFYLNSIKDGDSFNVYMNNISTHPNNPGGYFYCRSSSPLTLNSTEPINYIYNGTTYTNFVGNHYYQTYAGNDTDGDGLGDTPFVAGGVNHYHPLISPIDAYLILTPTTVTVSPAATTLEVAESVNFTAEVFDQRGEAMPGAVPMWSSSNTTRGVVNATTGCFEALSPGEVTVTAGCEGCTASAIVTVVPATKKTETVSFEMPDCTFAENNSGAPSISVNASAASINGSCLALQGDGFTLTVMTTSMEEPAGGRINATYDGMVLETDPLVADLPLPGTVSGSIRANLTGLPAGAGITTTLNQTISDEIISAFQLAASNDGLEVDAVAFTMNIVKTNLTNGKEITNASVRMAVSPAWVRAHGGVGAVRIIRWAEDDTKEVLETRLVGTDPAGNLIFEAYSPNGLSLFGLSAISRPAAEGRSSSSGGDLSDVASFAGSVPAGEARSFSVDRTAIGRVTVKARDAVSDLLVTVEKASLPKDVRMPGSTVYEIEKMTLYRAGPSTIAGLVIEFSVPKTWLDAHGLSGSQIMFLQYTDEGMKNLPVTLQKEDEERVYYSAEADGFSYFAIVAGKIVAAEAPVQAEETPVPTTEVVQTAETSAPPASTTVPKQTPVMEGLAILALGAAVVMRRR
ncbi:Ig-like domain-containing protein [Methanofollis formosanus]|nr:Ig-like domain-containing protein [Methanofollis formosanus]